MTIFFELFFKAMANLDFLKVRGNFRLNLWLTTPQFTMSFCSSLNLSLLLFRKKSVLKSILSVCIYLIVGQSGFPIYVSVKRDNSMSSKTKLPSATPDIRIVTDTFILYVMKIGIFIEFWKLHFTKIELFKLDSTSFTAL